MERKIRKRCKRPVALVALTLATLGSVAFGAEPANAPSVEVGRAEARPTGALKPSSRGSAGRSARRCGLL